MKRLFGAFLMCAGCVSAGTFEDDAAWFKGYVEGLVKSNRGELENGQVVFYADAEKHYNLIFTRGFAYVYEHTGDLIAHEDAKAFLSYQLAGIRADGCAPDRVDSTGLAIYSPGAKDNQLADHAKDNGPFIACSVTRYVERSGDLDFFRAHEPALRAALDFVTRGPNGLVWNDPVDPQCVYGFTDIVRKTGDLLFTSVLYYDACLRMEAACRRAGVGDPAEYARRAALIRANIGSLWDKDSGAFFAASGHCRQYDVWGTALVLSHPGLATPEQAERARAFLVDNHERYLERGQIRHLLAPETWQDTFEFRASGVYQNGGYWATPLAWLVPAIEEADPELARRILADCLADFRARGVYEWVNGGVKALPNYFVSAASAYAALNAARK